MFSRMNIGARLYLGFGVLVVLLLVVFGLGKWGMSSTDSAFSEILTNDVGMMRHANRARSNALGLRRYEKDVFINIQSSKDVEKYFKSWNDERAKLAARLDDIDKLATLADDKKVVTNARGNLEKYEETFVKVVRKIQSGELKNTQEANLAMVEAKEATHRAVADVEAFAKTMLDRVEAHSNEASSFVGKVSSMILGISVLAALLGIAVAILIRRSIILPLVKMRDTMTEIAVSADFSRRTDVDGNDEIGQTAQAFNSLVASQQNAIGEVNGVVTALAAGDFSKRVDADLPGDLKRMKDAVNGSADSVKTTVDALNDVMKALYNGNFDARTSAQVKGEFKVAIDQATQAMQSMQAMLGDVGAVMGGVAQGNLAQRVRAEGRGDLDRLKENINASLVSLANVMKAVGQNTQQVAAASNQTSNAIGQISDGAQNQMHAINQVATAVQQTAAAVTEVAKSAESANARAQGMGKAVNDGIADMNRMIEIVQAIATNADRIDKITDVIEKIANKTNLLSLNAAIEAARAGEHGKGFAVVAEEVGKLAASAGESTQEIAALVKQAVEDAERATGTVAVVNKGMQEISNGARQTEAELQRISAAMEQQNAAITEINANVGSLNRIASANASAAEEITSTVIELARLADGTRREVEKFST